MRRAVDKRGLDLTDSSLVQPLPVQAWDSPTTVNLKAGLAHLGYTQATSTYL